MSKTQKTKPKKKYTCVVFCQNCRERYECEVPKGQTVWDFLQSTKKLSMCTACGCEIVQSRYSVWGELLR